MYLMEFDDDKKRTPATKIAGGCAIYERRYGVRPTLVLVNEADKDAPAPEGVTVRAAGNVRRDNYWIGQDT
jgi:hypothetical protein